MIINRLKPTYVVEKIYYLNAKELKAKGIKAIFTDLDNTLIAWNNPRGTAELKQWVEEMRAAGIKIVVISNNTTKRVSKAVNHLNLDFESWSLKPLPKGIKKALRDFDLNKDEVLMVGDQLLTDVFASNIAGVKSVWTKQLVKTDMWQTWLNRKIEKLVIKQLFGSEKNIIWKKGL